MIVLEKKEKGSVETEGVTQDSDSTTLFSTI